VSQVETADPEELQRLAKEMELLKATNKDLQSQVERVTSSLEKLKNDNGDLTHQILELESAKEAQERLKAELGARLQVAETNLERVNHEKQSGQKDAQDQLESLKNQYDALQ
jgi:chromosome segregation ATPase